MPAPSSGRRVLRGVLCLALTLAASPLGAQRSTGPTWTVVAPDAALAWFTVLAEWRVDGAGALPFIDAPIGAQRRGAADAATETVARRLRADAARDVLHFVPLYYPSAQRAELAAALRAAAASAQSSTPRGTFVVAALERTLSAERRREYLTPLATALERARPVVPDAAALARLQLLLDSTYLPALAQLLGAERLDAGRLLIAPALGPEGRVFSASPDRSDNLVAVGAFSSDPDPEAPLLAFVREVCFPLVSRAASTAGLGPGSKDAAGRASLAAVRCGADVMDACLADRAESYRRFWLRQASRHGLRAADADVPVVSRALSAEFDRVFPVDPAFATRGACRRALSNHSTQVPPLSLEDFHHAVHPSVRTRSPVARVGSA
ncbi:MAG: hypothetical protein ACKVS7_04285 [Gemmatimonadaceae bacterium]